MIQLKTEVRDIMTKELITLKEDTPVKEAARILSEAKISGAPVVDDEGRLIGLVTESDLVVQDVRLHFPTYIQLLDGYIYFPGSLKRFEEEFKKAVGAKVGDIMDTDVVTIDEHATIEDAATLMTEKDVGLVPVLSGNNLVGIIAKRDIVRSISRS
ncbi:MAG TPA: CBS domain-containing protein [Anaerolineae bacterium]|nr:CBS domain-containing protein [Anaerolineae bacterium]